MSVLTSRFVGDFLSAGPKDVSVTIRVGLLGIASGDAFNAFCLKT